MSRRVTKQDLKDFTSRIQMLVDASYNFTENPPVVDFSVGRKYARVYVDHGIQKLAHCFVNINNGDILKVATWKAPAKHPRGNIFDDSDGMDAVTSHGAKYLR